MRSSLLKLYRLGDRLAGRLHKGGFDTPGLDLDRINRVTQGELSLELLEQVSTCVSRVREWEDVPQELGYHDTEEGSVLDGVAGVHILRRDGLVALP